MTRQAPVHEVAFGVLGPLEVRAAGRVVALPGARQRALLTALLLRRGTVVPCDRLVDDVFGDAPPSDARNALQTNVARLRHALGQAAFVVVTRPPGYTLDVHGDAVDVGRFTALLDRARDTAAPAASLPLLEEALTLWRGPAYAEFADTFARGEALKLGELRLAAVEDRAAALLRLGRRAEAAAAIDPVVAAEPWRERAVELLVSALALAGRSGDALAAYRRFRDRLRDELGLDPSAALQGLEAQVLRGQLDPSPTAAPAGARTARPTAHTTVAGHGRAGGTSFVGRREEVALVRRSLAAGRLVTLLGPGGVGKTRLAREAAAAPASGQAAVWWVDLAAVRDAAAVRHALTDAVGLELQPGTPVLDALRGWLRAARGLLVLDNCEHVLPAAAEQAEELLAAGPELRLLATSREPLAVTGEHLLDVRPLAVPEPDAEDAALLTPAVRLFLDRAARAGDTLRPTPRLLRRTGEVCRALDGLPLAIELAAARIGTLTVDDLADRLDARFDLLKRAHDRDHPRHRTLRAVVDWSFDLLTPDTQRVFLALSVFASAFDLDAAERVVDGDGLSPGQVADHVARLADRSMLTRPGHSGAGRYRMLKTLRAYAADRLPAPEADRLRRRHAAFLVDLAERAETGLYGADELVWAGRVERWLDDLRAAWSRARDAGDTDVTVRLAAALTRFGYWRMRPDVLAWGTWAADAVPAHPRLGAAHAAAAHAAWMSGRLDEARRLAQRGVALAGGPLAPSAAAPLEALGDAALLGGDLDTALASYRGVAALAGPGADAERAVALANQTLVEAYAGDPAARTTGAGAVAAARAAASPTAVAMARFAEGEALAETDPAAAADALEEAGRHARAVGNRFVAGIALTALVALRGRHGPPAPALALYRDAVRHWQTAGHRVLLVTTLRNLVILLARTGRDEPAAALAATLRAAAPVPSYGTEAERIATALQAVRHRLGGAAYDRAWAAGAARTIDQAVTDALRLLDA